MVLETKVGWFIIFTCTAKNSPPVKNPTLMQVQSVEHKYEAERVLLFLRRHLTKSVPF